MQKQQRTGLILTGGGARAAYQIGVLKAIAEWMPRRTANPFPVICGTSAGALNAAALAIHTENFRKGVNHINSLWKNSHPDQIYRTDPAGVLKNTLLWIGGLLLSAFGSNQLRKVSLLDNAPMVEMLERILPCERIQESIDKGRLHALSITACGYSSGQSVTFYQGASEIEPWQRTQRIGVPAKIEVNHLLASAAIPFFFPARKINREYFGDGSMRQLAPISSALHLGATRLLIIGVNNSTEGVDPNNREEMNEYPSLAHLAGHALNSIFLDSVEMDLESARRINDMLDLLSDEERQRTHLKHVDVLAIMPSEPLEAIARKYADELPWTIRLLMRLIGASHKSGSNLVSYLLSETSFCRALIDLGYKDATTRKQEITEFLHL